MCRKHISLFLEAFARSGPQVTQRKVGKMLGPNQLLWDLGVNNVYDNGAVHLKIKDIENTFHLVMILEHFEVTIASKCKE